MESQEISKGRKITGWVMAGLLMALLLMSSGNYGGLNFDEVKNLIE